MPKFRRHAVNLAAQGDFRPPARNPICSSTAHPQRGSGRRKEDTSRFLCAARRGRTVGKYDDNRRALALIFSAPAQPKPILGVTSGMRIADLFLGGFLLVSASTLAQQTVDFSGTVKAGESYKHAIGHGLMFVVRPEDGDFTLGVEPAAHDNDNFARCVTPPFHGPNPIDLLAWQFADAKQGKMSGAEPAALKHRQFQFVLNAADQKKACDELDAVLYQPPTISKDGSAQLGKPGYHEPPLGIGRVTIEKAEASQSPQPALEWVRFNVHIEFPKAR